MEVRDESKGSINGNRSRAAVWRGQDGAETAYDKVGGGAFGEQTSRAALKKSNTAPFS